MREWEGKGHGYRSESQCHARGENIKSFFYSLAYGPPALVLVLSRTLYAPHRRERRRRHDTPRRRVASQHMYSRQPVEEQEQHEGKEGSTSQPKMA